MLKRFLIVTAVTLLVTVTAVASDREDDVNRTHKAAQIFQEIMNTPDHAIPHDLLDSAKCIAIIPGDVKFAFIFGGNYGRGVATCRTGHGWSAPMLVAIDGGSVGYQIGGSSTDIVMLFMNDHALHSLLSDKFKLGADASVAAGPVGRNASAGTDLKLSAEIPPRYAWNTPRQLNFVGKHSFLRRPIWTVTVMSMKTKFIFPANRLVGIPFGTLLNHLASYL
jgi:lipid-binding SYLF domain-containing protein